MRRRNRLLVLAWLAWAVSAFAPAAFARGTGVPIRLVAPGAGAALAAGSTAELEWTAGPGLPADAQEWEAFLSLDGGATYPVRLTPHLDQDLRRVRFQVPPVPAADARILLRFGDERRETAVELPERFTIAPSPVLESAFAFSVPSAAPGEPALPGRAGVVAWVEGSRRGAGLRQVIADAPAGLRDDLAPPEARDEAAVLAAAPSPPQSQSSLPRDRAGAVPADGRRTALARAGTVPLRSSDILLLIQRQNE
jgi:hypothetical protein